MGLGLKLMRDIGLVVLLLGAVIHLLGVAMKDNDTKRFGNGIAVFGGFILFLSFML
jgi:hypothetical protein